MRYIYDGVFPKLGPKNLLEIDMLDRNINSRPVIGQLLLVRRSYCLIMKEQASQPGKFETCVGAAIKT